MAAFLLPPHLFVTGIRDHCKNLAEVLKDKKLDGSLIQEASEMAYKAAKPIANTAGTPSHRKVMVKTYVKMALEKALGA